MSNEERIAMDRHSEALEAHAQAINNLTTLLSGIFEEYNPIANMTTIHPLHRTLNSFIECLAENSSKNQRIAELNSESAETIRRAVSDVTEVADKMQRAGLSNDDAANKMLSASSYIDEAANKMLRSSNY